MKTKAILIVIILLMPLMPGCSVDDDNLMNVNLRLKAKRDIEMLNLDKKFNIDEGVYEEFLHSLTFDENGNFRGAIFAGVEQYLDDSSSDKFWSNFGISIRDIRNDNVRSSANDKNVNINNADDGGGVYMYYKPKPRGCKYNTRWICVIGNPK